MNNPCTCMLWTQDSDLFSCHYLTCTLSYQDIWFCGAPEPKSLFPLYLHCVSWLTRELYLLYTCTISCRSAIEPSTDFVCLDTVEHFYLTSWLEQWSLQCVVTYASTPHHCNYMVYNVLHWSWWMIMLHCAFFPHFARHLHHSYICPHHLILLNT